MQDQIDKIKAFYSKFNQTKHASVLPVNPARAELRHNLLLEEVNELRMACQNDDIIGIADGLADCLYILLGTAYESGMLDIMPDLFAEVHRSNMTKLQNGKPVLDKNGKITKGKDYEPPNLNKIIYPF